MADDMRTWAKGYCTEIEKNVTIPAAEATRKHELPYDEQMFRQLRHEVAICQKSPLLRNVPETLSSRLEKDTKTLEEIEKVVFVGESCPDVAWQDPAAADGQALLQLARLLEHGVKPIAHAKRDKYPGKENKLDVFFCCEDLEYADKTFLEYLHITPLEKLNGDSVDRTTLLFSVSEDVDTYLKNVWERAPPILLIKDLNLVEAWSFIYGNIKQRYEQLEEFKIPIRELNTDQSEDDNSTVVEKIWNAFPDMGL